MVIIKYLTNCLISISKTKEPQGVDKWQFLEFKNIGYVLSILIRIIWWYTHVNNTEIMQAKKKSTKLTSVTRAVLPQEAYDKNANIYKILANPNRLKILNLLKLGEMSVENILAHTKLTPANLSQHLALMRHNGLVQTRRGGLNIFYRIVDPRIVEPCKILHDLRHKHLVI